MDSVVINVGIVRDVELGQRVLQADEVAYSVKLVEKSHLDKKQGRS